MTTIPVLYNNFLLSIYICSANSRVGTNTKHTGYEQEFEYFEFCFNNSLSSIGGPSFNNKEIIGAKNETVFPEPVSAHPRQSFLSRIYGIITF